MYGDVGRYKEIQGDIGRYREMLASLAVRILRDAARRPPHGGHVPRVRAASHQLVLHAQRHLGGLDPVEPEVAAQRPPPLHQVVDLVRVRVRVRARVRVS
jgi:hypothetical protein